MKNEWGQHQRVQNNNRLAKVSLYTGIILFLATFFLLGIFTYDKKANRDILIVYDEYREIKNPQDYKDQYGIDDYDQYKFIVFDHQDERFQIQSYPTYIVVDSKYEEVKLVSNDIRKVNEFNE
ncbi:hypothetical protein J2T13_003144 [Paenibacillus sp. DS2015]|uniref:hypothetical protein n=1 Tax=Paenibacillus sp. DS2015 TaxID=3373917 RepID=UPI003D248522